MADALLSPTLGAVGWASAAGLTVYCARQVKASADDKLVPLMGVSAAFVFSAQMINFAIPATGSSGHLGGGLLLAVLLGPHAALLAIASVLVVQALLFGDGGLLALGCNILNLGLFPCFVAYPVFQALAGKAPSRGRIVASAIASAVLGLQLGSFAVVLETFASGRTELPFFAFALLMQPIHLAIGLGEGLATAAVLWFVRQARPELLAGASASRPAAGRFVIAGLAIAALLGGSLASFLTSTLPDGLEWALAKAAGPAAQEAAELAPAWPTVDPSQSYAGVVGAALTLAIMVALGLTLARRRPAS